MEARKITIVSTKNQKKSVIMSAATTLAELKTDLNANGIDYDGMTFYEGTSKTELLDNNSVLPTNVPYKGTTTNELVFMLTNSNKKIKSGMDCTSRTEVYAAIKQLGLADSIAAAFGKNFTQCKTADLIAFVESNSPCCCATTEPAKPVKEEKCNCKAAIEVLLEILSDAEYIDGSDVSEVLNALHGYKETNTGVKSSYSDDEINEMFEGVC